MIRFRHTLGILAVIFLAVGLGTGCQTRMAEKLRPSHDQVLVYPLAFDLTYLRTMEALENVEDWELEETEKEKGMIRVRNINFSQFDDADESVAVFLLKRLGRSQTSIELAPESRRVADGDKLFSRIEEFIAREL